MKSCAFFLLCALTLLAFSWLAVTAAPRIKPLGTEACIVSPNPLQNGGEVTVRGSGFRPGYWFFVSFNGEQEPLDAAMVADDGSIIFALGPVLFKAGPGTYTAQIFLDNHRYFFQPDRASKVFAECSVEVVE